MYQTQCVVTKQYVTAVGEEPGNGTSEKTQ